MTSEEIRAIAAVLKDARPSPVHQVEAFEAWEEVVGGLTEVFSTMDRSFDVNRFDDLVGLYEEHPVRGSK